jgi:hypothetical protein
LPSFLFSIISPDRSGCAPLTHLAALKRLGHRPRQATIQPRG